MIEDFKQRDDGVLIMIVDMVTRVKPRKTVSLAMTQ